MVVLGVILMYIDVRGVKGEYIPHSYVQAAMGVKIVAPVSILYIYYMYYICVGVGFGCLLG